MREVLLLKYGEIALKGLNKPTFENILIKNIRRRLHGVGAYKLEKAQSTITITPADDDFDYTKALGILKKVFGVASVSRALVVDKDIETIRREACKYLAPALAGVKTFKVEAKRADKRFPLKSPEIAADIGGVLLESNPDLKVDVHNPELQVNIEIRDFGAFLHAGSEPGACGMPVGSNGKACLLISGGIDSPVAGYMMAKRGVELAAVHFASPPYTSERARGKVLELLKIVSEYSGRICCHVIPFTKIQEQLREKCPEELFTILMRRFMMRIAEKIAQGVDCSALITGESIGQVASQTMDALVCTDAASSMPVFRPLIGMDKEEIITVSRRIGTFETSILPYEDCCTVFTPKHPRTKPKLKFVEAAEVSFDIAGLVDEACANAEKIIIG